MTRKSFAAFEIVTAVLIGITFVVGLAGMFKVPVAPQSMSPTPIVHMAPIVVTASQPA